MSESLEYYKQQLAASQSAYTTTQNKYQALRRKYASLPQAEFESRADVKTLKNTLQRYQKNIKSLSSKISSGIDKQIDNTKDAMMSSIKDNLKASGVSEDAVKNAIGSKSEEMMGALNKEISNISNDVVSKLSSSSVGSLSSGAASAVSKLFSSDSGTLKVNAALGSSKSDVGTAETDSKIKSISSDDNTAIAQTVAFVTKPVTESVTSAKSAATSIKKEPIPTEGQIAAEVAKLKASGETDGSWSSTITSITNDLSSKIKSSSFSTDFIASVGEVSSGINNTIEFASPSLSPIKSVIEAGADLTKSVVDALPDSVGRYVNSRVDSFAKETSASILGDKLSSMKNIASLLPGVTDTTTLWSILGGLTGTYPQQKNNAGKDMRGTFGNTDADTATVIYQAANTICSNINRPDSFNFAQNKDLYDALLQLAANLGLTDLIAQLMKCMSGENAYFDKRTLNILKSCAKDAAGRGDIHTYKAITSGIGAFNVSDAKKDMAVIAGNITKQYIKEDKLEWESTLDALGIEGSDIVSKMTSVGNAYDGAIVSLMSATDTTIIDGITTGPDRALIQASMLSYA